MLWCAKELSWFSLWGSRLSEELHSTRRALEMTEWSFLEVRTIQSIQNHIYLIVDGILIILGVFGILLVKLSVQFHTFPTLLQSKFKWYTDSSGKRKGRISPRPKVFSEAESAKASKQTSVLSCQVGG